MSFVRFFDTDTMTTFLRRFPLGRVLISLSAAGAIIGPVYIRLERNPHPQPDLAAPRQFHNAQAMSMGAGLGLARLYHLWQPGRSRESLQSAAIIGGCPAARRWRS
ncbi:DUF6640 family protein [Amycolatopsis minnesotensis]|uniref:Uncharacterized protein n=1 Tax=Amycolatopsis minnesotensis TaxID=337894 RepID=A0ABN2S307_9PSEU